MRAKNSPPAQLAVTNVDFIAGVSYTYRGYKNNINIPTLSFLIYAKQVNEARGNWHSSRAGQMTPLNTRLLAG